METATRAPPPRCRLERLVGFDRLTVWHRRNGHACVRLMVAHSVLSIRGYARLDGSSSGTRRR